MKKNPTKHLLVTWLNILATVCFLGSPLFFPPHPCGSRSNSPKKNKKRKEKKRARFTWCSSVCIALAVWYVWNYTGFADSCIAASAPVSADGEREIYIYTYMCKWVSEWVSVSKSQMAVPDGERAFPVASIVRRRNKKKEVVGRTSDWKRRSPYGIGERTTIIIFFLGGTLCPTFDDPFFLSSSQAKTSPQSAHLYTSSFGWFLPNKRHVDFCFLFFFFGRFLLLYLLHIQRQLRVGAHRSVGGHVMHTGLAAATNKNSCGSISGMWLI